MIDDFIGYFRLTLHNSGGGLLHMENHDETSLSSFLVESCVSVVDTNIDKIMLLETFSSDGETSRVIPTSDKLNIVYIKDKGRVTPNFTHKIFDARDLERYMSVLPVIKYQKIMRDKRKVSNLWEEV